jgi:hypothetical protein
MGPRPLLTRLKIPITPPLVRRVLPQPPPPPPRELRSAAPAEPQPHDRPQIRAEPQVSAELRVGDRSLGRPLQPEFEGPWRSPQEGPYPPEAPEPTINPASPNAQTRRWPPWVSVAAGVALAISGAFFVLAGLEAIASPGEFVRPGETLGTYYIVGVLLGGIGAAQLVAAYRVFRRRR